MIRKWNKERFRDMRTVKYLKYSLKEVPKNSVFLYFGDYPDKKNPDIGYLFKLLSELRPDIIIAMIQIEKAKSWGVPHFVNIYL